MGSEEQLRASGLHVTAQRLAILHAVGNHPHATADDILEMVKAEIGTISKQGVYDGLTAMSDKGILRRIQPAGSPARFEDRVGDNHHHLICRSCSKMFDVDCAVDYTPCLTPNHDQGFVIDEAEVVYWGYCATCIESQPSEEAIPTNT